MIKNFLKRKLSGSGTRRLRNLVHDIKAMGAGRDLDQLARIYGTDKTGGHFYTPHYMTHFARFKNERVNLLEIGVGGYADPLQCGNSLRMWKRYFPSGQIFSLDIYDKSPLQEDRIKIFKGSQVDKTFLDQVVQEIGELDLIIDDGSHINEHVITTFGHLFPKLKDGGIYVIEDTQTSYWSDFGGESENLVTSNTLMNYFKGLTDGLNHKEFLLPAYTPTYFDRKIVSMHFYHNLIFIYKGDNVEPSNLVKDGRFM